MKNQRTGRRAAGFPFPIPLLKALDFTRAQSGKLQRAAPTIVRQILNLISDLLPVRDLWLFPTHPAVFQFKGI